MAEPVDFTQPECLTIQQSGENPTTGGPQVDGKEDFKRHGRDEREEDRRALSLSTASCCVEFRPAGEQPSGRSYSPKLNNRPEPGR
jgi:hypothetical protein